jgi:hypothetical protein
MTKYFFLFTVPVLLNVWQEPAQTFQHVDTTSRREIPSTIPPENITLSLHYFRETVIEHMHYSSLDMLLSIIYLEETSARMRLISMQGKNMGQVWNGTIHSGKQILSVNIPASTSNGEYTLVLEKFTGEQLAQQSIVLSR